MIDVNVVLWCLNVNVFSTLPVMLALFHELSYALRCCQMQQEQLLFLRKPIAHFIFLLPFLTLVNFHGHLALS